MADEGGQASRPWWLRITQQRVLFLAGLAGFVHEMVLGEVTERPVFFLGSLAMMGVTSFYPSRSGNG